MPVIGRLDKQVEDVIISPVSNRRHVEEKTPQETDADSHATPTQTPPADESSTKTDELPVWLL